MQEQFSTLKIKKEVILISSFLTTYLLYLIFINYDFSLDSPSNLYISQATLDNIDVSKRVRFFYIIIAGISFITPIVYFLFNKLEFKSKELSSLMLISATGILLLLCNSFGITNTESIRLFFILFLIKLSSLLLNRYFKIVRLINHDKFFGIILALSFVILTASIVVFDSSFVLKNILGLFTLITIFLFFFIIILKRYTGFLTRTIFSFFNPVVLSPLFIFLAIETHLFVRIKYHFWISHKLLFVIFISTTVLLYLVWKLISLRKKLPSKSLKNYIVPSALFSYLLLTIYHPIIEQSNELFELANPAISQMRLFSLNEIPFVDFMSSHLFSEQFYGVIYNCIYGFNNNLSFLSYQFLYEILFYVITHLFLVKLLKSQFLSFLFLITFPFISDLFSTDLFFSIIIFYAIQRVLYKQSIKKYFFLLLLILFSFVWRLDLGVSSLFTTLLFFPLTFYVNKKKVEIVVAMKAFGLFILSLMCLLGLLLIFRSSEHLLTSVKTTLHYISASQAHGYSLITNNFNQQFFIFHLLLPLLGVVFIFISIYYLRNKQPILTTFQKFSLSSSLFLFLIYLTNIQRGLVRHSFIENTDSFLASTFYIAATLFIISFINTKSINKLYITFLGLSFCLIIFIKYFPLDKGVSNLETVLTNSTLTTLSYDLANENSKERVFTNPEFEKNNYTDFKHFLDVNLSSQQTFLDFSNTPMLYYYCNRRIPSFFCQSLQNTVDEFLQIEQLKRINPSTTPVVVYSNYPPNWWDNTDGVPNAMRQSKIAEYIYKNYIPFGIINNRSIWVGKGTEFNWMVNQVDTIINQPQTYHYNYAASTINNYIKKTKKTAYQKLGEGAFISINPNFYCFTIPAKTTDFNNLFLSLEFNSIIDKKEIKIDLFGDIGLIGTIKFFQEKNENSYMLPLSNHYLWHKNIPKYIQLSNQDTIGLLNVAFYKNTKDEY